MISMNFLETLKNVFVKSVPDTSNTKSLDTTDWAKLFKHVVVVSASAGLTYLASNMHMINLGEYTVVVVPVLSFLINAGLKYIKSNEEVN